MPDIAPTISRLIKDHQKIEQSINACQATLGDLALQEKVETAKEIFTPGRLENQRKKAIQLEKELMTIEENLRDHFLCEEKVLLEDFKKSQINRLFTILGELIKEHENILRDLGELRKETADLSISEASVVLWNNQAWKIKPLMRRLADTIKTHAGQEEALYKEAEELIKEQKKKK